MKYVSFEIQNKMLKVLATAVLPIGKYGTDYAKLIIPQKGFSPLTFWVQWHNKTPLYQFSKTQVELN